MPDSYRNKLNGFNPLRQLVPAVKQKPILVIAILIVIIIILGISLIICKSNHSSPPPQPLTRRQKVDQKLSKGLSAD